MILKQKILFVFLVMTLVSASTFGMYCPKEGRFLQRDPAKYINGMNLYEYVVSNSILYVDPYGLAYCNTIMTIRNILEDLIRDKTTCCNNYRDSGAARGAGQVICCDGRAVTCVWHQSTHEEPSVNAAFGIIAQCIRAHEETHLDDVEDCPLIIGSLFAPDFRDQNEASIAYEEWGGYNEEVECLNEFIGLCDTADNPTLCKMIINTRIGSLEEYMVTNLLPIMIGSK